MRGERSHLRSFDANFTEPARRLGSQGERLQLHVHQPLFTHHIWQFNTSARVMRCSCLCYIPPKIPYLLLVTNLSLGIFSSNCLLFSSSFALYHLLKVCSFQQLPVKLHHSITRSNFLYLFLFDVNSTDISGRLKVFSS